MKIFLSHSTRDKALVREIRSYLPSYVKTWLDENDLLVGMDLKISIRNAIQVEADYVVIFLGREAVRSEWVKNELNWAIERENSIGRTFVLPVLLEDIWDEVEPENFRSRLYLKCFDQSEASVKAFAERLKDQLFAWLCEHLDESHVQKLRDEKKEETLVKALEKGRDMMVGLAEGLPKQIALDLKDIFENVKIYNTEIQLERVAKVIKRELCKWKEKEKEGKENYKLQEDPMAKFCISLTFGGNEKVVALLENLSDEIDMWERYREDINSEDVLIRIKKHLGIEEV